jgi:hypothetical protein
MKKKIKRAIKTWGASGAIANRGRFSAGGQFTKGRESAPVPL